MNNSLCTPTTSAVACSARPSAAAPDCSWTVRRFEPRTSKNLGYNLIALATVLDLPTGQPPDSSRQSPILLNAECHSYVYYRSYLPEDHEKNIDQTSSDISDTTPPSSSNGQKKSTEPSAAKVKATKKTKYFTTPSPPAT